MIKKTLLFLTIFLSFGATSAYAGVDAEVAYITTVNGLIQKY